MFGVNWKQRQKLSDLLTVKLKKDITESRLQVYVIGDRVIS